MNLLLDVLELIGSTPEDFFGKLRIGLSVIDAMDGKILFANEEFARILGLPVDSLRHDFTSFLELTHPDDRERNIVMQQKLISGEVDHFQLEKRYLRHDGSIVWANVTVTAIRRSEDRVWSVALVEDITARKFLEQQLDAAEAVTALSTWKWAVKSRVLTISPNYNLIHGRPMSAPAPVLAQILEILHPEDREHFQATFMRALASRTGYTEEYRIIRPDGAVRWLRSTATCQYDAAGEVTYLVGATLDITDVKSRRSLRNVSLPIRNILQHIEQHWSTSISLKQLGTLYGISPRSIHNYFAAEGTTPNRYIKQIRLRHARQKLQDATAGSTVTAVAVQCGFSNLGHFAKDYRQEFGEAPSETIKANKH